MKCEWLSNEFNCGVFHGPFFIENGNEYVSDLGNRLSCLEKRAEKAGASEIYLKVIQNCRHTIMDSLDCYFKADLVGANQLIEGLIQGLMTEKYAVDEIDRSWAFPGERGTEVQFFRGRKGGMDSDYCKDDFLPLRQSDRLKSGNSRFSIPGNPSYYLANTSYGCWIELGFPAEHEFSVAPVELDGKLKILNLAVSAQDFSLLEDSEENLVKCWLQLFMLMIATSYRVKNSGEFIKPEYIISQEIMMACNKLGLDGVAYYSKRVSNESFAFCAINLALFIRYDGGDRSGLSDRMKIDEPLCYALFKQLNQSLKYKEYDLRSVRHPFFSNMGTSVRNFPYLETDFYSFDRYLFSTWKDRPNGKGKNDVPWGVTGITR